MLIKSLSASAAVAALTLAPMAPASAATFTLPAGLACSFELQIDQTGDRQVHKEFVAPDGSIRTLDAGKGSDLVFTNVATGATFSLAGNGAVRWQRFDTATGSSRLTLTGHTVVIYFPTDKPAGPSTTLVVGREDIAVDRDGNFTRLSRTGRTIDICAALT